MPEERGEENKVRVLTSEEHQAFQGMTIDNAAEGSKQARQETYEYYSQGPQSRVYVKTVGLNGWLPKLILTAVVLGGLAFLIFVFLPLAIFAVLGGAAFWFLKKWKRL